MHGEWHETPLTHLVAVAEVGVNKDKLALQGFPLQGINGAFVPPRQVVQDGDVVSLLHEKEGSVRPDVTSASRDQHV